MCTGGQPAQARRTPRTSPTRLNPPRLCPAPHRRRRLYEGAFWLGLPLLLGVALGLALPPSHGCPQVSSTVERISAVIGWVYFCAW